MLILDMTNGSFIEPVAEQPDQLSAETYPTGPNPLQPALQSVQIIGAEPWRPPLGVIGAGVEWLEAY